MEHTFLQNRELSWLKFNQRVLEEAECKETPLLDRFAFLSIFTTNLDEFFMVRVGALYDYLYFVPQYADNKTGMTAKEELHEICCAVRPLYQKRDKIYEELSELLARQKIVRLQPHKLNKNDWKKTEKYFQHSVKPLLSPQIIDPRHPFPHLNSKQLYIAVSLKKGSKRLFGLIPLPGGVERLFFPDKSKPRFLLAEDLLLHYTDLIFEHYTIESKAVISVTRSADIDPDSDELDTDGDYRQHMKKILKRRQKLFPVRLEVQGELHKEAVRFFTEKLGIKNSFVFDAKAPLNLSYFSDFEKHLTPERRQKLIRPAHIPHQPLTQAGSMIGLVRQRDMLLSYPYESMEPFLRLVREAAFDPSTASIKITLYRIAAHSRLARYLMEAAENGKDVTVLLELRARFDEENNIEWAQRLEEAGCHVIYGMENYKVHSKICLITVQEANAVFQITQIGTGNYNEKTAKLYTDFCFMTADEEIGRDAQEFFLNMSTGNLEGSYESLWVAPAGFKQQILAHIDREIQKRRQGAKRDFDEMQLANR